MKQKRNTPHIIFLLIMVLGALCFINQPTQAVPPRPGLLQELLEQGDTARYEEIIRMERANHRRGNSVAAQVQARRVAASTDEFGVSPNLAPRGLVILANFTDFTFQTSNSLAEMDSMLNGSNYTFDQSYGSARKYFQDQSAGQYNPHFDVVGPVNLSHNMAYYGSNNVGGEIMDGGDVRLGDFVLEACRLASQMEGVNFANYDNDNDGYIDFVYIIYAGYNEAEGASSNTLWPASWDIASAISEGYTSLSGRVTAASYTFHGKVLDTFAYSSELRGERGYSRAGIGTFCHEFSHVLGLPDYYDIYYETNYEYYKTPGDWHLMDGGSYGKNGRVPVGYTAHDKWFVGWQTPTLLTTTSNITIPCDGSTYYYINQEGVSSSPIDEQHENFFLENRQKSGWDVSLPGHGLVVWRVKYNRNYWINNEPNSSGPDCIANKQGEVSFTIESATGDANNIGSSSDPFPGTGRVTSFAPFANYQLTNIAESKGTISFSFAGQAASALNNIKTQQAEKIMKNGQLLIRKGEHIYDIYGNSIH